MMTEETNTHRLLSDLLDEPDLSEFFVKNNDSFYSDDISCFLNEMMKKYRIEKNEVIANSNIERSYCYQILRGIRNASRDNYLKIALGIGMDLHDTQTLLKIAKTGSLYVRVKRDAAVIFCINKHFDLKATQELLDNQELKILE